MDQKTGSLEKIVKGVLQDLDRNRSATQEEMLDIWRSAAGSRASRHSRPVSFKKGRLAVNVDGSSWLYELTTKRREILRKLQEIPETKKIKEIRFRIGEVK